MEDTSNNQAERKQKHTAGIVFGIFAIAIILICGLIFLFNYRSAYNHNTNGGFIPPSFGVIVYYFWLAILCIIVSVLLKLTFKSNISILALLFLSVLLPIFCYNFNYCALKEDGILYPLVDEGGIFHFIAIGDYDFDGMNDEYHHIYYDERKYSSRDGGSYDDTVIFYVDTTAIGTGAALNGTICSYKEKTQTLKLHLSKYDILFKQITLVVAFQDPTTAQKISFYLSDSKLDHTINSDNTVSLVFDADTCADWQNNSENEFIEIPIQYIISD